MAAARAVVTGAADGVMLAHRATGVATDRVASRTANDEAIRVAIGLAASSAAIDAVALAGTRPPTAEATGAAVRSRAVRWRTLYGAPGSAARAGAEARIVDPDTGRPSTESPAWHPRGERGQTTMVVGTAGAPRVDG